MNLKRTATIVVVGAALAAWLAAAATSGSRETIAPILVKSPPIDARGETLANEIARLHEHLRPAAVPRQPGRNLFSFAARQLRPAPAPPPASRPALTEAPAAARPAAPMMKLSGIAEDATADGVVRTAIISAAGQLFLAKEGQNVTPRFRVSKISADVVELSDLLDGTALRLALK
jgi:hypothetical protein